MNSREGNTFRYYLELSKIKIMLPVSLTGFTGYFIFDPVITWKLIFLTVGIFCLAISASVLNQIQEIEYDRLMERTRSRPLPSEKITRREALIFLFILFTAGTLLMFATGSMRALFISLFTIFWYNGIYTYLKRLTAFAVIPGALTGALPPLIGWVAAGGAIQDRTIILVQLVFFIGQIPHFWLFILKYGNEYTIAGLPSLTDLIDKKRIRRLIFFWIMVTAGAALCFYFFGVLRNNVIIAILAVASLLLMAGFAGLAGNKGPEQVTQRYSMMLNTYFLLIMILLISDRIL